MSEGNDMRNTLAFLTGLALGVIAGVLFAPRSGTQTRDSLRERLSGARDYLRDRSDYLTHRGREMVPGCSVGVHDTDDPPPTPRPAAGKPDEPQSFEWQGKI